MNQNDINDIKADAFAYVAGMPFTASGYLTYSEEERKCWEDGILDAIDYFGMEPQQKIDAGTATDGDQEMDLVMSPEPYFGDCFDYLEECLCH